MRVSTKPQPITQAMFLWAGGGQLRSSQRADVTACPEGIETLSRKRDP
jgi:hypothetical protein